MAKKNSHSILKAAHIHHPVSLSVVSFIWLLAISPARAQTLPPISPERLNLAADRIESLAFFGGDYGASGGVFAFRGNGRFNLSVDKAGGGGDVGDPRPLGDGSVKWNPTVYGNIGYLSISDEEAPEPLTGNTLDYRSLGMELGGGARFWFSDHFSVAPALNAVYVRTEQTFNALTDTGKQYLVPMQEAGWVDWRVETWSAVPSMELMYEWMRARAIYYVKSNYSYYHTESFNNSSVVNVNGNSQTWKNTFDADIPIGVMLFGHELRTGGHLDETSLFGNFRTGLDTSHLYTVDGRLVLDMLSSLKMVYWMGLGVSYTWSGNLSGWSVGLAMRLKL
jgi:hypothetical protein